MSQISLLLAMLGLGWFGPATEARAAGYYDAKTGLFHLSYTYAKLPNSSDDAQALLSAEVPRTNELDALVTQFYQVVSDDLGKVTGGRGYLASPEYTSDIKKADVVISPDIPFTIGGQPRGGWGTLNGFKANSGQLAIYIQSLKQGGYSSEAQRLTVVHELCHYLFGLPDEYNAQYCPMPGPGGQGCLMDNYNTRTWPGFLCNDSSFGHNAGAVTFKDPSIPATKSCQAIVDDFFRAQGVSKDAKFSPPSGSGSTAGGLSMTGGSLSASLAKKVQDKAQSLILDQKAKGLKTDRKTLLPKLASKVFDLLKDSGIANPTNLESIAAIALESVGVPPIVPETLVKLAPLFEAEAKRLAESLANRPGRNLSILDGLLKLAKNPGGGAAAPPVGDAELEYLTNLSKQAAATNPSQALDPATAPLQYLSQISAKLDAMLIMNDIPGAVGARDLSKQLDAALAKLGSLPDTSRDDPFKKARATLVIAPPIIEPEFPGLALDQVIVHPGDSPRNYNDLRLQCVSQFNNLIDRERVKTIYGTGNEKDWSKALTSDDRSVFASTINFDKKIEKKATTGIEKLSEKSLIFERTQRIQNLINIAYDGIQKDTIKSVAVLVPTGGLPLEVTRRLEDLRPLVIGKTDLRLDVVQVGTASIPKQLRDLAVRSDGSILTVTDQDEVGAVSQRLANDQSQGTWVNLPLQGAIYYQPKNKVLVKPALPSPLISYTLFDRMDGDRYIYPVGTWDDLKEQKTDEIRLALRPFYVDAASKYQFVAGFTRELNVPSVDNLEALGEANADTDQLLPRIALFKTRLNVEDPNQRASLETDVNRTFREASDDNLTFDLDHSSKNVLVFKLPAAADGGVSEGWYTPVLVLKKGNFNLPPKFTYDQDKKRTLVQATTPDNETSLHFTFSIGTPRTNALLIPSLVQDVISDPKTSYLGTLSEDARQAVVQVQMIVGAPIKKALVTGVYQRIEFGETPIRLQQLDFRDDGQAPDKAKDDGVYTGVIPLVSAPRYSADYRVFIAAENQDGTAFIDLAESIQAPTAKELETVTNLSVPKFQRATSLNFRVEGSRADRVMGAAPTPAAGKAAGKTGDTAAGKTGDTAAGKAVEKTKKDQ